MLWIVMGTPLSRFKPAAKIKTLLLLSAGIWTGIGCILLGKGLFRLALMPEYKLLIFFSACIAAILKSTLILDRVAIRGVKRILTFTEATCLGAVYSGKTWLLVLCMAGMGGILRNSSVPATLLSFIYLTIGLALIASSRHGWRAWYSRD